MIFLKTFNLKLVKIIKKGGAGIIPTDTIYGLVGSAFSEIAIQRIYRLKKRDPQKPLIILIGELTDLQKFNINIGQNMRKMLLKFWPGPTSIILPCSKAKFHYLHRGTNSLAFRMPKKSNLTRLLQKTGPLVAPSANPEGQKPAQIIKEAQSYFGDKLDFYVDGGNIGLKASQLISIADGKIKKIR